MSFKSTAPPWVVR